MARFVSQTDSMPTRDLEFFFKAANVHGLFESAKQTGIGPRPAAITLGAIVARVPRSATAFGIVFVGPDLGPCG